MATRRPSKRVDFQHHDIPTKANRILNIVLFAFLLIIIRIWHLSVIQYESRLEESRKPQKRTVVEPAIRATIRDRFNIPLALNKIQYQAAIVYNDLKVIPSIRWEQGKDGKKIKVFKRKNYIKELANLLAHELHLDAEKIEDLIHAKASYYSQIPFIIKDEISEQEYYRLKMLEKDWPGIYVQKIPKRYYPKGRIAADIIGYMGAINKTEYDAILHEMKELEHLISKREEGEDVEWPAGLTSSFQARKRLKDLQEKAYTIHDYVGKTGVEGAFEQELRGFYGKKSFYSDSKGNLLRELPGSRAALSGHRLLLTISSELQEYAEKLLAENEEIRFVRLTPIGETKKTVVASKHPWIKGGSIVVLEPQTGEVLALASFPRFDPNDFIVSGRPEVAKEKRKRINRWFESEAYIAAIWNQQQPLERELINKKTGEFYDDGRLLTWDAYLNFILPEASPLHLAFKKTSNLQEMTLFLEHIDRLLFLFSSVNAYTIFNAVFKEDEHEPFSFKPSAVEKQLLEKALSQHRQEIEEIKADLKPYFEDLPQNYDKVLMVDLCRLAVDHQHLDADVLEQVGQQTVSFYRQAAGAFSLLVSAVKEKAKSLFHEIDFKAWREKEEKNFLQKKRLEEKLSKTYPKPYLDYLDQQEILMFNEFWTNHKWDLIIAFLTGSKLDQSVDPYQVRLIKLPQDLKNEEKEAYETLKEALQGLSAEFAIQYLSSLRSYEDLTRPLLGRYRSLRHRFQATEKDLAAAFYPVYGFGYGRSYGYRQAAIQGSIFKLVTTYEALVQRVRNFGREDLTDHEINPLTIVDRVYKNGPNHYVGNWMDGTPIPQIYKGGRLPRSLAHQNNGEVDVIKALGVSSNPYFSLLAAEHLEDPMDLARAAQQFGYGSKTGIELPGEIKGKVPDDLAKNPTGLYAMAIGQHSLVVTPLQTAVALAAIANGGKILKPKILSLMAGREPSRGEEGNIPCPPIFLYQDSLATVGIDFPLFTAASLVEQRSLVQKVETEVKRKLPMPSAVRLVLLKGLRMTSSKIHHEGLPGLTRLYREHPETMRAFTELKNQILGKTSTSESVEHIDLDLKEGTNIYTHVWFGGISFQKEDEEKKRHTFLFKDEFGKPELIVVVYLRFGGYGKEAAPLASQVIKKWRELKQKYHQF